MPIVLGAVALWAGLSIAALRVSDRLQTVDWQALKPTFALIDNAHAFNVEKAYIAIEELLKREAAGELSAKERSQLQEIIRDRCITGAHVPTHDWIHLAEELWLDDKLTPAQSLDLARKLASLELVLHRRNSSVTQHSVIRLAVRSSRAFPIGDETLIVDMVPQQITMGSLTMDCPSDLVQMEISKRSMSSDALLPMPVLDAPGDYPLTLSAQFTAQLKGHSNTRVSWSADMSLLVTVEDALPDTPPMRVDQASSDEVRQSTKVTIIGVRSFFRDTNVDAIIGCIHIDNETMQVRAQRSYALDGKIKPSAYHMQSNIVVFPVNRDTDQSSLEITITPESPRIRSMPRFEPDLRPVWFGPPVTISITDVRWFESLDGPDIPEEIQRHRVFWKPMDLPPPDFGTITSGVMRETKEPN